MHVLLNRGQIGIKSPRKEKRKKLSSSIYFKADLKTTILSWESKFSFEFFLTSVGYVTFLSIIFLKFS